MAHKMKIMILNFKSEIEYKKYLRHLTSNK